MKRSDTEGGDDKCNEEGGDGGGDDDSSKDDYNKDGMTMQPAAAATASMSVER